MPYCAMAVGFIHNFCESGDEHCTYQYPTQVVIDITTIAEILDGNIIWWNDTSITRLNPDKDLPQERIHVVAGPKTTGFHFNFVERVRRGYSPDFAFRAGEPTETFLQAWMEVSLSPFSFAFVPFNGTQVEGVERISVLSRSNQIVSAKPSTIEACARDTYDKTSNTFFLSSSM
jgi:hypothetical protein